MLSSAGVIVAVFFVVVLCHGGTSLQVGRSRVQFPMVSLEFFINIILPAADPGVD
jgi:hypothetical protein